LSTAPKVTAQAKLAINSRRKLGIGMTYHSEAHSWMPITFLKDAPCFGQSGTEMITRHGVGAVMH
jgi:hypothetical protein